MARSPWMCELDAVYTRDPAETSRRLAELRQEHRALDLAIAQRPVTGDALEIKRMKKRKLQLRDMIARLESSLIPDQPA